MYYSEKMEQMYRHRIEILVPRLINSFKSDVKAAMDRRHRSVIVKSGDVELIDIVSQDVKDDDYYDLASDIIISEQYGSIIGRVKESEDALNRLMSFQKALRL
jgi:hypothetical protein